jgi:hypothetical protein
MYPLSRNKEEGMLKKHHTEIYIPKMFSEQLKCNGKAPCSTCIERGLRAKCVIGTRRKGIKTRGRRRRDDIEDTHEYA